VIRPAKIIFLFSLLMMLFLPSASYAADIPFLTWEKGRVQEIILSDENVNSEFSIQMVGPDGSTIDFIPSEKNADGFVVFTAEIPTSLPVGVYTIESNESSGVKTILAGVSLIKEVTYDIRAERQDLTLVVGLFTFITVTLSSLRSRKYSTLSVVKADSATLQVDSNIVSRLVSKVVNLRANLTQGVSPSLFRHLLGQESLLLLKLSRPMYFFLPAMAIAFGLFAAISAQTNGGLEKSQLLFFFIITVIGLIDSFSGIFALFTFWVVQFFYGDVASINQILVMVAAAIAWIGPSLVARIYQDAIKKDFTESQQSTPLATAAAVIGSAIAATALFYGGYKLLLSLLGEVSDGWQMQPVYLVTVFAIALTKAIFIEKFALPKEESIGEDFEIVRVVSPQVAFSALLIVYGFTYIWTENALRSLIAALLFAAPYFLLFIRFEPIGVQLFAKLKRNFFLESVFAVAASYLIYLQVQRLPELTDQRAEIYLIAAAIPGLIHGIYSSICDSAQREERINP
jgi:hypothetical protein